MVIDGNRLGKSQEDRMILYLFNSTAALGKGSVKEDGELATLAGKFTRFTQDKHVVALVRALSAHTSGSWTDGTRPARVTIL